MVDYEYIYFCYKVLKEGESIKVNVEILNSSKDAIKNKSELSEDDKLAIHRISFIESCLG